MFETVVRVEQLNSRETELFLYFSFHDQSIRGTVMLGLVWSKLPDTLESSLYGKYGQ